MFRDCKNGIAMRHTLEYVQRDLTGDPWNYGPSHSLLCTLFETMHCGSCMAYLNLQHYSSDSSQAANQPQLPWEIAPGQSGFRICWSWKRVEFLFLGDLVGCDWAELEKISNTSSAGRADTLLLDWGWHPNLPRGTGTRAEECVGLVREVIIRPFKFNDSMSSSEFQVRNNVF